MLEETPNKPEEVTPALPIEATPNKEDVEEMIETQFNPILKMVEDIQNSLSEFEQSPAADMSEEIQKQVEAQLQSSGVAELTNENKELKTITAVQKDDSSSERIKKEIDAFQAAQESSNSEQEVSMDLLQQVYGKLQEQIQSSKETPYDYYSEDFNTEVTDSLFEDLCVATKDLPVWIQ